MKTMSKQMISFLLAILLCFSVLPMPALATAGEAPAEEPQQEANSGDLDGMESPVEESTPTPEPTPAPEPTPVPTPAPGSEGTEEPPVESESPDAQDEPQETPAPTEQEEELPPVDETEEALPVEENPELPELLPTEEPQPVSIGLDIEPISYAVVDEPLVTVTFHYTDAQVATPTNLPTSSISAHTYHPLTKLADNRMAIPANLFPDEIQVDTAALKVTLDGELDITAQAEYDAASGMMYLPARYWGHEIDVDWFCAYAEVASVTISANVGVNMGGAFQEKTHAMTLPSNADMIEIPLPEGRNAVVSQCGIDLPESAYSIEDGVLYVQASPLGGDITVTAYAAGSQRRMLARSASARPATVTHTRSADQIYYGYYTSYYTANGNPAFCLDPTVSGLNAGVYAIDYWLDDPNDFLVKCCYYLYGGPGYGSVKNIFEDPDALWAYGMCHAVASYAYMGSLDAFKGLDDTLTGQLVQVANIVRSLPAVPSGFECFVYNTGGNNQPLVGWQYTPASWEPDPEPEPESDPTGSVAVQKSSSAPDMTEGNPCYSLEGAVFDVYSGSARVGSISTDVNGYGSLSGLPVGSGYYLVERTPPAGFAGTDQEYSFTIYENATTTVAVSNIPQNDPATIMVRKQDADTGKAEPQGGAGLGGAQFTVKYYKGSYTSASALNGATPARTWVLETDEDGFAMLHPDYLVSGDPFYYNSAGTIVTLPLGTVTIQESKAPEGYLINNELFIRQIAASGSMESVETYNEPTVKESVIRGGVSVEKWDMELNCNDPQGDARLSGAVFEIYNRSASSVVVGGKTYGPDEVVHTLTTGHDGVASTANDLLPYGEYEIVEKTAPIGYLNTGAVSRSFEIRANGVIVNLNTADTSIQNDIIRGNVLVEKWDNETSAHAAQGGGTLEGATFEIINRSLDSVLVQDVLHAPGEVVYTTITDETGTAYTPEYLLPYGTYEVREIAPPFEGYLSTGVLSRFFEIREHGKTVELNTAETAIRNDPLRGDLKGIKIADGTAQRLAGVPFSITSKTTGESHIVITDVNGEFSTASEWNPHSQNTNAGQTDRDGVWFGELDALDDGKGALLYDDYIIEELPCEANEGFELLAFEVSVYRHNTVIDLGTLTDDHIPVPEIFTTALEKESMGNTAYAAEKVTIVDTVYYSGLKAGTEYTLKGVLMDKATGEPLMVGENQVTAVKTFRATAESGSTTMEFTFDASALKGKAVVVFETLYLTDKEIAAHTDIEDANQTITFLNPEIGTTATGTNGEKMLDATAKAVIVDTVAYTGLQPGHEYTLKGKLMDKTTGEAVQVDGQPVTAETTFTPEAAEGSVTVTFALNAISLKGKSVVVFESLYHNGREIAVHADIEDEDQTVSFAEPKIGTKATGKNGEKELSLSAAATIVDAVKYENLAVGQEYTIKGTLMDKATGKPVLVDEKEVTAQTTFTPDKPNGTVEVTFTFDASSLKAKEVVVFERLYIGDAEIAAHADIEDKDQTVTFNEPKIGTSASGKDGEKQLAISRKTTIIDKVKYEGLTVGQKYTLKGTLMDKATGKALFVDDQEVTAETSFTPDKSDGIIEVTFTFDASSLKGKEVVVFERLYIGENEIASHTDIEDKNQTVSFVAYAMKLTKIDRATNNPLDGAEFTLYGEDGKEIKLSRDKDGAYTPDEKGSAIISTVDGVAIIKDLTDQKYTLREVTVPKGYVGYTEPIPFEMEARDTEDDPFPVTVYNSPEGHKEGSGAKTGRDGLPMWALYGGVGLLVFAAGVGVLYLRKKKMN